MVNRISSKFEFGEQGNGLRDMLNNLGETEDRAKAVADALSAMADEARADFDRLNSATEAMSTALGPEFAADLDRGKAAVADLVDRLHRLGLTYEEIEANADQLAVAAKKLDDIRIEGAKSGLDQMGDSARRASGDVDRLSDSARGANSATANMIGNSAQDVGELAGVSGSAGVALGQMAEYASDARLAGEGLGSALRSMALVAGPIAALAAGVQLVGVYMKDVADTKAFNAEQVNTFKDAITDTGTVVSNLVEAARELEAIEFNKDKWTLPGGAGFMKDVQDIVPLMAKANITAEEWFAAMQRGGEGWRETFRKIDSSTNLTKSEMNTLVDAFTEGYEHMLDAQERAAIEQAVFGDAVEESGEKVKRHSELIEENRDYLERNQLATQTAKAAIEAKAEADEEAAEASQRAQQALSEMGTELMRNKDATDALRRARLELVDQTYSLHDAELAYEQQVESATETLSAEATTLREARGAMEDTAGAAGRMADEQLALKGLTRDTKDGQAAWNEIMSATASQLDGPLHDAIVRYIQDINNIPAEKNTVIRLVGGGAVATGGGNTGDLSQSTIPGTKESLGGRLIAPPGTATASAGSPARIAVDLNVNLSANSFGLTYADKLQIGRQIAEAFAAWLRGGGDYRIFQQYFGNAA